MCQDVHRLARADRVDDGKKIAGQCAQLVVLHLEGIVLSPAPRLS